MTLQKCIIYKYQAFGIEDYSFQEVFVQEFIKESTRLKMYANIRGINRGINKQGRIESLQPRTYGTGRRPTVIRLRKYWESTYLRLVIHLLGFPLTSEHDNAIDALEGGVQVVRSSVQAGSRVFLVEWG